VLANVKGASYDLRLGTEYYLEGNFGELNSKNPYLIIPPFQLAIVTTLEKVNMPDYLVAHFGLRLGLVKRGLLFHNEPQIDPGYRGRLACLLFNLSKDPVRIEQETHFATIEFEEISGPAPVYQGDYANFDKLSQFFRDVDKLPTSALDELNRRTVAAAERVERIIPFMLTALAAIITLLSIVLGIFVFLYRG